MPLSFLPHFLHDTDVIISRRLPYAIIFDTPEYTPSFTICFIAIACHCQLLRYAFSASLLLFAIAAFSPVAAAATIAAAIDNIDNISMPLLIQHYCHYAMMLPPPLLLATPCCWLLCRFRQRQARQLPCRCCRAPCHAAMLLLLLQQRYWANIYWATDYAISP